MARSHQPHISAVIPAYNEEECIGQCVEELAGVLRGMAVSFEIIVADDGSTDRTADILKEMRTDLPEVVIVRLDGRHGQSAALDAGLRTARGELIVTLDADMQNDPADIPRLVRMTSEWDVICGYRRERHDNWVRRVSSRVANGVRNRLTGESIRDVGCSLRVFPGAAAKRLKLYRGMHRFLPTLLRMDGWTITEVPVNHRPRPRGTSKYGIGNRLFRGLRDLMAVRWMQSRWLSYDIKETIG
jgi:glycosyltransferase involved in cell wall biosynthesis